MVDWLYVEWIDMSICGGKHFGTLNEESGKIRKSFYGRVIEPISSLTSTIECSSYDSKLVCIRRMMMHLRPKLLKVVDL